LPVDLPGALDATPRHQDAPRQASPVLLIGDDPHLLAFLRDILAGQGFNIIVSSRMSAAFVAAVRYRPSVVCFFNLLGNGADLSEFIAMLPAGPAHMRVPVIIMAAHPLGDKKLAEMVPSFVPGYDAFLPNPVLSGDILACVRRTIRMG
jgi:DNA-binding NtrC family response regulator